jgi:hypothetical protein|tara:strand:+ start:332 stop:637 length:306 start_codon:yes stop_codon:yes gene_type:complete
MSIIDRFKEGKLTLTDAMYDVFLPIVSHENKNVVLFQHLHMTEELVFRALNGLPLKDYERFDKLRKMNTGWILANGGQVMIVKSGEDTQFISTFKSTGGLV